MIVLRHALGLLLVFVDGGVAQADRLDCIRRHFHVQLQANDPLLAPSHGTDEERLEHPTLADMFEPRYRQGPIQPVADPHQDPGRARVERLFEQAYPAAALVETRFFGHRVRVQPVVADALGRVEKRLAEVAEARPFLARLGGTFNPRRIAGTDRTSAHAWGIAIDLDPDRSFYWRWSKSGWQNRLPQSVVDAFEAEQFIWGGRWFHFDTMHFEYRPELFDPACYPR